MDIDRLNELLAERYRVQRELGRGGMAVVYQAHDWNLGRDVAFKVLLSDLAASLGAERFVREIGIAAKLNHPNILTLFDRGEVDGLPYYTMPYVEGESLRDRLDREKQLPVDEALRIAAQVAAALHHAHEHGVVHRDVKPDNILLAGDHVLVADFGIAKALTEAGDQKMTSTGIALGTVPYMAPEQGAGEDVDARSDLYSLGCVLFEMIGGEPPFTGPNAQAVIRRHALDPPPSLSTIRPTASEAVERAITKALAKNPVDRYKTAEQMRAVLSDPDIAAVGFPNRLRRVMHRRAVQVGTAAVLLAAVAPVAWQMIKDPTIPETKAGLVAVLPFEVNGDFEPPLDAGSITTLVGSFLGYLDRYRILPSGTVSDAVSELCEPPVERFCGTIVANKLQAQYHVTGRVDPVRRDSVSIAATITDVEGNRSSPPVVIRGQQDEAYASVKELFRELTAASAGPGERVVENAALSTDNLAAFAAFMNGELFLAEGSWKTGQITPENWDSAGASFQRAVHNDSSFALAWYRLALVRDWNTQPVRAAEAAARAEANGDQLSDHDRRLLRGYRAHIEGDPYTAEGIYKELLEEDPDDFEALVQLGYLYWGYSWRMDRTWAEVVEPMRRAMRLAPHPLAAVYLPWGLVAGSADDPSMLDEADSVQRAFGIPTVRLDAIRAIREGDSLGLAVALDSVRNFRDPFNAMIATPQFLRLATFVDQVPDLNMYIDLVESISDSANLERLGRDLGQRGEGLVGWVNFWRDWGYDEIARYEAGRGRWRAAQERLRAMSAFGDASTAVRLAMLATAPIVGPFPVDADSLLRELERGDFEGRPAETGVGFGPDLSIVEPHLVMYSLGLLQAELGDYVAARAYADRLEGLGPRPVTPTLHKDLALAIRADVLMREDRFEDALAALDEAPWRINNKISWTLPGERENFLRAQALQGLGQNDEALRWYVPNGERLLAPVLLASSHYHRGEIYEAMGDTRRALWHYGAFVELWRDADPEYQPVVQEVQRRLAELSGES